MIKKKNNKKGFTLVELLAVIVILLAISVVAIPSISAGMERSKAKTNENKQKILASYGELYFSEHQTDTSKCVQVSTLKTYFNLSAEETQDANGNDFTGAIKYNSSKNMYEYKENENC